MSTETKVYTHAELQSPATRPRITRPGDSARVLAPRFADPDYERSRYQVATPCCGKVTVLAQWHIGRVLAGRDDYILIECGKAWGQGRGNSRRGGCRAWYEVRPIARDGQPHPTVFELTWTGR